MPSAQPSTPPPSILGGNEKARPRATQPFTYSGSLDSYEHIDSTVSIGREIPTLQIKKILSSADSDTLIRDLAITGRCSISNQTQVVGSCLYNENTVSERGVVFLRNQDVTTKELLSLGEKLSTLTGSVSTSPLLPAAT
jgi:hypothetical protein